MSHILIVDDSPEMRDGMAQLLRRAGYEVSTARNGKAGFLTLYTAVPDLILLDLMMPEMGGVMFLRMLRRHHYWNHVPVMVVTGLDPDEGLVQEAQSLGVLETIHKGAHDIDFFLQRIAALFPNPAQPAMTTRERAALTLVSSHVKPRPTIARKAS